MTISICLISLVFFSNCVSTRQDRINNKSEAFSKLSQKDKKLVEQGRIRTGMDKDAVYIAWGEPVTKQSKVFKNKRYDTWIYSKLSPILSQSFGFGGGYGLGNIGRYDPLYGYHNYFHNMNSRSFYPNDFFYNPSMSYYSKLKGKVNFLNGIVNSWEYYD